MDFGGIGVPTYLFVRGLADGVEDVSLDMASGVDGAGTIGVETDTVAVEEEKKEADEAAALGVVVAVVEAVVSNEKLTLGLGVFVAATLLLSLVLFCATTALSSTDSAAAAGAAPNAGKRLPPLCPLPNTRFG